MKKSFISDFEIGEKLKDEVFVVKNFSKKTTKTGQSYWDLKLIDKTGELGAKVWNNAIPYCDDKINSDSVVMLNGSIEEGMNGKGMQLFVSKMNIAESFDKADFIQASEEGTEVLWKRIDKYIENIKDENLKKLLDLIFADKELLELFKTAPAAEKAHHNFISGLMRHNLEMLAAAEGIIPFYPEIDRDLVIAGIILHDIGKVYELAVDVNITRTNSGHFLGHIYQGAEMVSSFIKEITDFPEETKNKIINIILSHHGSLEFGSPILPLTIEAYLVNLTDVLSSKLQMVKKHLDNSANSNSSWSDYNHLLSSRLYLGEKKGETQDIASTTKEKKVQTGEKTNLELPF
jgi:3'-5' exoribonuclease